MSGLVDLNGLTDLSAYSVRIQDLDEKTSLSPDDVYLIADKVSGTDDYVSKLVNYNTISSETLEEFRTHQDGHGFKGTWNFTHNNFILTDTLSGLEHLKNDILSNSVAVNLSYLYNVLLQKIYDLSAELYGNPPHLPSFVGQVVVSQILSTESSLKEIYGENTTWEQITDVFLCGVGEVTSSDVNSWKKYGDAPGCYSIKPLSSDSQDIIGEQNVTLTDQNIPRHTHGFSAQPSSFQLTWTLSYNSEFGYYRYNEHGSLQRFSGSNYGVKTGNIKSVTVEFSGERWISTASFGQSDLQLEKTLVDVDTEKSLEITSIPHTNIPPFVTKYCWRRTE